MRITDEDASVDYQKIVIQRSERFKVLLWLAKN